MHEVLVNRLGGLSLPRKSVVRLTDRRDMTLDVYRGRKTTIQQYGLTAEDMASKRAWLSKPIGFLYIHACFGHFCLNSIKFGQYFKVE